jgi:hypothetical protein
MQGVNFSRALSAGEGDNFFGTSPVNCLNHDFYDLWDYLDFLMGEF